MINVALQPAIISNFFNMEELDIFKNAYDQGKWGFTGHSVSKEDINNKKMFWKKDLYLTPAVTLFTTKIEKTFNIKLTIEQIYVNGQAHGQCGSWHRDALPGSINQFTLIYFPRLWQPEYGGHLLYKMLDTISILPEFNKAVLFESTVEHIGLEPTYHCKTQRESVAVKFKVLV
jgi:hypothetical protein